MTKEIEDGGAAFPSEGEGHGNPLYHSPGMSLRDWFAGMALAGGLATEFQNHPTREAYAIADAMLKARKEPSNG